MNKKKTMLHTKKPSFLFIFYVTVLWRAEKKNRLAFQLQHCFNSFKQIRRPLLSVFSTVLFLNILMNLNMPEGLHAPHTYTNKYILRDTHRCDVRHSVVAVMSDSDNPSRLLNNWLFGICVSCSFFYWPCSEWSCYINWRSSLVNMQGPSLLFVSFVCVLLLLLFALCRHELWEMPQSAGNVIERKWEH